jgi:hypothetical protein
MGWRDLIEVKAQTVVAPWLGGRSLRFLSRRFTIRGPIPADHGWYSFEILHNDANVVGPADLDADYFTETYLGFLVGDRFIPETAAFADLGYGNISRNYKKVELIEESLDKFSRVEVGRLSAAGRLFFKSVAFPMGPEEEVLSAFLDRKDSTGDIKGVTPALQAAFDAECKQRDEAEQRRIELARLRREEEERLAAEERRAELAETLGDGAGRRAMASVDFQAAATAALSVGGAELLDVRDGHRNGERVVRYRLEGRRFECVCDAQMRIIDAGVCLTDESTGEKGDTFFTLESLPGVVKQAIRQGVLVVFRHV